MSELFVISDEFEKKLHPEARKLIHEWIADVQCQVQLDEVSECLNECVGIKDGDKLYDVYFGDIFLSKGAISQLKRDLLNIEFDIVPPLKKIYEGRVAKAKEEERKRVEEAREEQRKREEEERQQAAKAKEEQRRREEKAEVERREKEAEERWDAAFKAIKPPVSAAFEYLKPEEYKKFAQSISSAIDAFLDNPELYLSDERAYDYRQWCREIKSRRETEELKITAESKALEYNARLNKEIARLKSVLCPNRKDHDSYFKKQIKDRRYTGQSFTQFLSSEEERDFDRTIVGISRRKLDEIVSSDFRQFIDSKCWRSYFLLPSAGYSFEGVPYLDFMLDVFAVVETRVWLKPGQKNFGDYIFKLPWREEKGYSVLLQELEFLGYHYLLLAPEDLGGYVSRETIPLVLLKGLLNGETKPAGVAIMAAADGIITYKIPKFKDVVNIPDDFASYLRSIGSIDEMVSMGIMTQKIANIAKSESAELEVERKASLLERRGGNSKKARAFQLFSQGKGPSSPEVKALGLHKSTRFKYYNQYLAVRKP